MAKYQPQLKRAIAAINILETANPDSDEFCNVLAELHVCTTILEPYSEGMLEAIASYQQAINLAPKYASPHNNLGNVYRKKENYELMLRGTQIINRLLPA